MVNQIKMAVRDSILLLYDKGWSRRKIAATLGLDRETVGRQIRLRKAVTASADHVPTGILGPEAAKPAIPPIGSEAPAAANPAIPPIGSTAPDSSLAAPREGGGRSSDCASFHEIVLKGIEACLTAQRIYQDLKTSTASRPATTR
jgi:hypothetical protein